MGKAKGRNVKKVLNALKIDKVTTSRELSKIIGLSASQIGMIIRNRLTKRVERTKINVGSSYYYEYRRLR